VEAATAKRKELDMQMKRLQERNRYVAHIRCARGMSFRFATQPDGRIALPYIAYGAIDMARREGIYESVSLTFLYYVSA
jgi:hypothetical protein